jgi:hypothetical protein
MFIDTTTKGLSSSLETQIENSGKTFTRVSTSDLENNSID